LRVRILTTALIRVTKKAKTCKSVEIGIFKVNPSDDEFGFSYVVEKIVEHEFAKDVGDCSLSCENLKII
jgi:hypothetical protein